MSEKRLQKRDEISDEYKWKLEDMYETDELWEAECEKASQLAEKLSGFKGHLADSAATLLDFFKKQDELSYYLERIVVYANERSHQDTAVSKYQAYVSKAETLTVQASGALAFASPEILRIDDKRLESFYSESNELVHYKRAIDEIMRQKEHTLSAAEENILAQCGEMAAAPENIFSMFNNADIKFPYITDVEGNKIRITHGNFIDFLSSKDRSLRKQVFRGVYDSYKKWSNTVSMMYISKLKNDTFYARVRKYDSARAMYLSGGDIPESVYDNLIETVHAHLPALHRYMALRKKLLGVEHLHMYDLFAPIVDNVQTTYTYDEAKKLVAKALEPMGDEYVSTLKAGMESGWIDVYENENKRSGAYSWGAYGTHPYVLLNYADNLDSVFTLAHEMGHAMHTYYSNEHQSITYAGYLIFVAEVASTCNESLLMHYMLEHCEDENERKYLMTHFLDVYENENKRSGAYSWGAYGTHPYVLLNYADNLDSVFTLAHEMGHAMHTYYSNEHQSITYAGYLIFVAEVASTCNESLLMHYMLEHCEDENERKYLMTHFLDGFRTTLFRQAQFAEFEHIAHRKMQKGEPVTKDVLNELWHELNVQYYGPDMRVDDEISYEWMRIPHFYTPYYVYQYSTGYSAAVAFSKKILEEGKPAVDKYIGNFLCGGCSKNPIELLKSAGVDMSTPKPVDDALNVFEDYLKQFEAATK